MTPGDGFVLSGPAMVGTALHRTGAMQFASPLVNDEYLCRPFSGSM